MKMENLAYTSIEQFSNMSLRLENCEVKALHRYVMQPACEERFIYITKGQACFFTKSMKMKIKERDMIYIPRDTAYQSEWLQASTFVVIDMLLCDREGAPIGFGESPCVLFNDSNHIYDGLLSELAEKADTIGPFDWLERLHLSFKFLCQLARDTTATASDEKKIKKGIIYLENNFAENFPVDVLAEICALSPTHFRKLFVACKGTSPSDYRNRLRIQRAAELLRSGDHTVAEAAEQVGINDIKYFGKLFVRYAGLKPSALKREAFVKKQDDAP